MDKIDRKVWTEEVKFRQEDRILFEFIQINGAQNWAFISKELKNKFGIEKNGKQCRERWNNNLSPSLKRDPWTPKEEKLLFDLHKVHGNQWSVIAAQLRGRTDNSTKNHFYSIVRKNLRKFNKTKPKDEQVIGNIQDLLADPALNKILLKKPRHYYKKKGAKAISKSPKRFPDRKTPKPITPVHKKRAPDFPVPTIVVPKPFRASVDLNTEHSALLPSLDSYRMSARSSAVSYDTRLSQGFVFWENKSPRMSLGMNRNSFVSSEAFSRRESRTDTGESGENRLEGLRSESGEDRLSVTYCLPPAYSVRNSFQFY